MTLPLEIKRLEGLPSGLFSLVGLSAHSMSPRLQSLAARRLLAEAVREVWGFEYLPGIAKDVCGKPRFPDYPAVCFSLSHCSDAAMAVVACSPVGCDIEPVIPQISPGLEALCLDGRERLQLSRAADKRAEFTRIWTRKEASVKRLGRIPDDVAGWPSSSPNLITLSLRGYFVSIAY